MDIPGDYAEAFPPGFDPKQFVNNLTDQQLLEMVKSSPELTKQYDSLVKNRIQGTSKALSSVEYLKVAGKIEEYLDPEGGLLIHPSASFILKAFEEKSKEKVFINIVQHEIVDEPQQKMLVDYENQPGLRIPMSVGRVKQDHDKKGEICKVVDVVLNPRVTMAARKDEGLLLFMFEILQNYIFQKYQIKLSEKFNRLKELLYKGNSIEVHRVKGRKTPKIQQMSQQISKSSEQQKQEDELFESLNTTQSKTQIPKFTIYTSRQKQEAYDSETVDMKQALIQFQLPLLIHSKGILLEANEEILHILVKGLYEIYLRLPIRGWAFTARFIKNRRVLEVTFEAKVDPVETQQQDESEPCKGTFSIESQLLYDLV